MSAGRTYRVHLVSRQRCVAASLYPPGTDSFDEGSPVRNLGCDEYVLFTPGPAQGGRYSIQVRAPRSRRGALPYRVQVARAGEDDTAPGLVLANDKRVRGSLRGSGADVLDLYRFDVRRPSILDLRLKAGGANPFNLQLVGEGGRRIACACGSDRGPADPAPAQAGPVLHGRALALGGGRALHAVAPDAHDHEDARAGERQGRGRAAGTDGDDRRAHRAGESGPVTVDVERFDPLAGWQFYTRFGAGRRRLGDDRLPPPTVGRWRVRATYDGTRTAAPSGPAGASFTVAEPLGTP